jgi:hypothetical protein
MLEIIKGSPLHVWMPKKFVRRGNEWRYVETPELRHQQRSLSQVDLRTTVYGRSEMQRHLLSYAHSGLLNSLVPSSRH